MEGAAKSSRRVVLDGIIQSNSNHLSGQVKFLDTVPKTNIAVEQSLEIEQVWSLTQFYSVDFLQSRISVKKVYF